MEENEYIPNSTTKSAPKPKASAKENSNNATEKGGASTSFSQKINLPKIKLITGAVLSLLSIYLLLACISYIFTWAKDQDQLIDRSFSAYIFNSNIPAAENWLGKFGAWSSHLLIFRGFGLPAFGLVFLLFLYGFRILFGTVLLPLARTTSIVLSYLVWGSIFLGYFGDKISYGGGAFGYFTNDWLQLTLGNFGTLLLHVISFFVLTSVQFNPNYKALFNRLFGTNAKEADGPDTQATVEHGTFDDIYVVNTITEDQIKEDNIAQVVEFDDGSEDDDIFDQKSELIVQIKENQAIEEESNIFEDTDFEVALGEDPEVPMTDRPLADDELLASKLVSEHGEYDPTKDLEGYLLPPLELMKDYGTSGISVSKEELETNKNRIVETLSHYKIDIAKIKATVGPTVTLYEIVPAPGVRISKIKNLEDDIALSLSAMGIRIIAPIPGKGTIGIEVANKKTQIVSLKELLQSDKYKRAKMDLPIALGKTIQNEVFVADLAKMPHLLIAGATGQGKSVGINVILMSLLYKKHPSQIKLVLIDPKKVELFPYSKIENHFLAYLPGLDEPIVTDVTKVVHTLNSLMIEMDTRYDLLKKAHARNIREYNEKFIARRLNPNKGHKFMPFIILVVDEFADLIMTAGKEVELPIGRLAQLSRAVGIHLIIATQRPSVNIITGVIKANFPARIAFKVTARVDSRTILDTGGADRLIGRGDMLLSYGSDLVRLQCAFVDTPEVEKVIDFIGSQRGYATPFFLPEFHGDDDDSTKPGAVNTKDLDDNFEDAARLIVQNQHGSTSMIQRRLKLGYNRAGRIMDQLEALGIVGPSVGSKAREVLIYDEIELERYLEDIRTRK